MTVLNRDPRAAASIRFYFSFRSPYAWLAAERLEPELGGLGVPIERIPVYPTPALFPTDPATMPAKIAYIVQDIRRLVRERGLTVRFPAAADPDWSLSHAAFLGAQQQGAGHQFMLEAFRKRFCEGNQYQIQLPSQKWARVAEAWGYAIPYVIESGKPKLLRMLPRSWLLNGSGCSTSARIPSGSLSKFSG